MKTGFINAYCHKPVKKYYSYHGEIRDCLTEPDPGPFDDYPADVPYGPVQYMSFPYIFIRGYYREEYPYEDAHNPATGTGTLPKVGQGWYLYRYKYLIIRTAIAFDTIALPDDSKIVSGKIFLQVYRTSGWEPFHIVVRNGMPTFPHLYDYPGDFNFGAYSGSGGSCVFHEVQEIELNEDGVSWINKLGITKFQLISDKDVESDPPLDVGIVTYRLTNANHRLEVGYRLPL